MNPRIESRIPRSLATPTTRGALLGAALALATGTAGAEIRSTSGAYLQIAPPPGGMPADDATAFCWNERQGVVLPVDIEVDAILHGPYTPGTVPPLGVTIPAGTRVSSHMLHGQPASVAANLIGSTLFGDPVIAVIWSDARLDATDAILGSPGVPYPNGVAFRGLEDTANQDQVALGATRVQTEMDMTTVLDQVRVLTRRSHAFSLDIGSDTEFSDPSADGDEVHDCGDMILKGLAPEFTVYWDDVDFVPTSFPDSPTPAPYGGLCSPPGLASTLYGQNFDLDGFDEIGVDLTQFAGFPIFESELNDAQRAGIFGAERLGISFDDDGASGWTDCATANRMPVESLSPAGKTYGRAANQDEVLNLDLDTMATAFPLPILSLVGAGDELVVHDSIGPDPGPGQLRDDDVDALDWLHGGRHAYFSVDQEGVGLSGGLAMQASGIYLSRGGLLPQLAVDYMQLGIPLGTDVDAFEFVWIPFAGDNQGPRALAVVFSVDQDDPQTPAVDESGRSTDPSLDPSDLYFSFMNGTRHLLVTGLEDDVDAISAQPIDEAREPGQIYCAVNPNSTGSPSILTATGSPSLSAADLELVASNAPANMTSLFYFGPNAIEVPFGHGYRCVGGTTVRMQIVSESGGQFSTLVDFGVHGSTLATMGTVNWQAWYRDVPAGAPFFNLSNGYSVIFVP